MHLSEETNLSWGFITRTGMVYSALQQLGEELTHCSALVLLGHSLWRYPKRFSCKHFLLKLNGEY